MWDSDGDVNILRKCYKEWSPLIRSIVDAIPHLRIYSNAAGQGLESWVLSDGRITLAGDAAHAHSDAFAAGGSLVVDDAWALLGPYSTYSRRCRRNVRRTRLSQEPWVSIFGRTNPARITFCTSFFREIRQRWSESTSPRLMRN